MLPPVKKSLKTPITSDCRFTLDEPACIARIRCEGPIANARVTDIRIGNLSILLFETLPLWAVADTDIRIPYVVIPGTYVIIKLDRELPTSKMWLEYWPQKVQYDIPEE